MSPLAHVTLPNSDVPETKNAEEETESHTPPTNRCKKTII